MNTFNSDPVPRTAKGGRTRARILECAFDLFRERGFEATTMRQIADAAEVSVGNAYYYFASKEHVVHGFHARTAGAFEERCRVVFAAESILGRRLAGVLTARVELAGPYHRFAPILFEPATDRASPFHPASPEARASRAATAALMARIVAGTSTRVHPDLRPELPGLLALVEAGLLRFWARDGSPDGVRTQRLVEHGSALATRLVTLCGLPFMGALRHAIVQLAQDLHPLEAPASDLRGVDFPAREPMSTTNAQAQIELHKELAPRYAYRYGFEFSRLFQQDWHAEMISHVPPRAQRILDLGCGTGFFLAELMEQHAGSVGLDISHEMLKVSNEYVANARLVTGDAERLPFTKGVFQTVFCKGSLHHTRDHVGFLTNCREALEPGGVLIMSEPCNDNPLIRLARAVLYRKSKHFDEGDQGFTRKGIIGLCEAAGFEVTKARKYGFLAYTFAGFPDHLGILRWIPGNAWITRLFIHIDRMICAIPGLSLLGFHIVIVARPK